MPTPPYVQPAMPEAKKRTGLLGGLESFGGLLGRGFKQVGRNFDANAVGGIDTALGTDFTPGMRGAARSNALMSIGQMLASGGRQSVGEGLQQGQQRLFALGEVAKKRREEAEARAAMQQWGQSMLGGETGAQPGAVPQGAQMLVGNSVVPVPGAGGQPGAIPQGAGADDPMSPLNAMIAEATTNRKMFRQMAAKGATLGNMAMYQQGMKGYNDATEQMQKAMAEIRQGRPTFAKTEVVTGPDGKQLLTIIMSDGKRYTDPQAGPPMELIQVNDGQTTRWFRKDDPSLLQRSLTMQVDPNTKANVELGRDRLTQDDKHWSNMSAFQRAENALGGRRAAAAEYGNTLARRGLDMREKEHTDAKAVQNRLGATEAASLVGLEQGVTILKQMDQAIVDGKIHPGFANAFTRYTGGQSLADLVGINGFASTNAYLAVAKQTIAKGMEGGVLRKEDEEKYDRMLPVATDSPQTARDKIATMLQVMEYDKNVFLDVQERRGLDVNRYRQPYASAPAAPAPLTDTDKALGFKPK